MESISLGEIALFNDKMWQIVPYRSRDFTKTLQYRTCDQLQNNVNYQVFDAFYNSTVIKFIFLLTFLFHSLFEGLRFYRDNLNQEK